MNKQVARQRRSKKTRKKIRELREVRLSVHRTSRHIYAQIISPDGGKVLTVASTVEKEFKQKNPKTGNIDAAGKIGEEIAKRAIKAGVKKVAFDRSGNKFHGRVKALAEAARKAGLEF
jgi:large subunit ribosomal protein L18